MGDLHSTFIGFAWACLLAGMLAGCETGDGMTAETLLQEPLAGSENVAVAGDDAVATGNGGNLTAPAVADTASTTGTMTAQPAEVAASSDSPDSPSDDAEPSQPTEAGTTTETENTNSEFEACLSGLTAGCEYDAKETACSSVMTTEIPLTDGSTWGNNEIVGGPYGAFVEFNAGSEFANPVNSLESTCNVLAGTFGEPAEVTADVLDLRGAELSLYTIFRPACMRDGETYPVITWGNGTCGQSGGYAALLATVASHGFVIIAANSRFTDAGNDEMLRALDLAEALNADPESLYYEKLDLTRVGAMGHSQGGSATVHAAPDPRVKAVILWNGGSTAAKPFLAISGERDIGDVTPQSMDQAVQGADQPGAWLYYHQVLMTGGNVTGHLTLMEQPERVWEPTVAWWQYMLNGDQTAKEMFVGESCGLCNRDSEFEFGTNSELP